MSTTVDNRVVEMRFDNKQFENNVQTSLGTLAKLNQSLKLTEASKGLENVSSAAKNVNLSGLSDAVGTVRERFSAFEVVAITALANITNSALNAGKRIVAALTIDPVKTGFDEYETKMNSIQTIMSNTASKGTKMSDVTNVLNDLNLYADKTIYNFAEMTRNIGTFTAAGVGLETSAQAIKGIANLAAASGSSSMQASSAMYQLSQALATGTVRLMDWNSVVNAGMGGEKFQEALKETARRQGIAVDDMIAKQGSFRESLQEGWLSADVLNETLNNFTIDGAKAYSQSMMEAGKWTQEQADALVAEATSMENAATKVKTLTQLWDTLKESAQSGWAQTWEIIVGNFDEAKDLFSEISDVIGGIISDSANARNSLLEGGLSSGWEQILSKGINDSEGYKEAIKEVAREHGIAVDDMIQSSGSFEASLKSGWLTSGLLSESLERLTSKTRGLSDEDLKNLGYTRDQIDSLEKFNDSVQNGSVSLEEFSDRMAQASGRENLIQALRNSFEAVMVVVKSFREAFREIFPPMTAKQLYDITKAISDFTAKLKLGDDQAEMLKRTFKGFFAVLDIIKQALSAVFHAVTSLFSGVGTLANKVLENTAAFGDWLVKVDELIKSTDIFNKVLQTIVSVIRTVVEVASNIVTGIVNKFKELADIVKANLNFHSLEVMQGVLERVTTRMSEVSDAASGMKSVVVVAFEAMGDALANSKFGEAMSALWNLVKDLTAKISKAISNMMQTLVEKLKTIKFKGFLDLINTITSVTMASSFVAFFRKLTSSVKEVSETFKSAKGLFDGIKGILDGVRGCLEAYQDKLKADILIKISAAIAILAASLLVLSLIDSQKLASAIAAISGLFSELLIAMAIMDKISQNSSNSGKAASSMIKVSIAIFIMASALKSLAELDWNGIAKGLVGIAGLTTIIVAAAKILGKDKKNVIKGATGYVIFAVAIKILASACKDMAQLSWEEMAKGLIGVAGLMASICAFVNFTDFDNKKMFGMALGILIMSAAIKVLASACKDFAGMSWEELGKGLKSIIILLGSISLFVNTTGDAKHVFETGVALIAIAAAMKILASAMSDFGSMSMDEIGKGLLVMSGALAAICIAVNSMPKDIFKVALSMVIIGASLLILAKAIQEMGSMSWEEISKGLSTLGISLAELAIALYAMKDSIGGAAALLIAAAAIAVLTPSLMLLGSMSWEGIARGLVALGGAFAVIGISAAILQPLLPAIVGLAAAIALLGVGLVAIGAGLILAGAGLSAIAIGITALAAALAGGVTIIVAAIVAIAEGIIGLIPMILQKIGEGIVQFCQVIVDNAPVICQAVVVLIQSVLEAIGETIPMIVDTLLAMLTSILESLVEYVPTIMQLIFTLLLSVLQCIADNISLFVQAGIDIITGFIDGIAQSIPQVIQSAFDLIIAFINGLTDAINNNTPVLVDAMNGLLLAVLDAGVEVLTGGIDLFGEIGNRIMNSGLVRGIRDAIGDFNNAVEDVVSSGVNAIQNKIGEWIEAGRNLMAGFINGIRDKASELVETAEGVVGNAVDAIKNLLGIASPSKVFKQIGRFVDQGLINGLVEYSGRVANATKDVASGAIKTMSDAISNLNDIVSNNMDSQPTIRPVMDLSNVTKGARSINTLFSRNQALKISSERSKSEDQSSDDKPSNNQNGGAKYQFTQNNYSPKALSRIEIYRQTKNQFSAMKGLVEES